MADDQNCNPPPEESLWDKGFVIVWRSFRYDPIYKDSNAFHLFIHCVLRASDRAKVVVHYGQKVQLERGQLITGRKKLHEETGIPENVIRHRLQLLERIGKITIKSTNKFSIITICNYDQFQGSKWSKPPADAPTNHQQTTTKKKIKEDYYHVEDSIELQLASLLLQEIKKNKPDFKQPNLQSWATDIGLMIQRDGCISERIRRVILWCQHDSFWWKNILSMGKLREKFDRLEAEIKGEKAKDTSKADQRPRVEYKDLTGGLKP